MNKSHSIFDRNFWQKFDSGTANLCQDVFFFKVKEKTCVLFFKHSTDIKNVVVTIQRCSNIKVKYTHLQVSAAIC